MTQKNSSKIISVVHPICCGLDVHMESTVSFDIHFFTIRNMHQHGWCLISHILGQDHCSQMRLSVSNEYVRF